MVDEFHIYVLVAQSVISEKKYKVHLLWYDTSIKSNIERH